ncbi:MAG: response regulator transcription factor, partial [Burkholderiales bacterium]|nr:response regulator transcription factor [Burkholderiales bacterium]
MLEASADIRVEGEAASGDEALARVRANDYDVAVLDLSMPRSSGIDLVRRVKLEKPALRVLVLSMHAEQQYAARALRAGASGYLTKEAAPAQLVAAIRKIAAGGVHITEAAAARSLVSDLAGDGPPHTRLSDREFQVLRLLAAG